MALSLEKVESLAPDQASLDAARKLLKPAQWPALACEGSGLVWGECQGSGATPYRVVVSEADAGYKCSCPSRKFPCKHSLALMWMRTENKVTFTPSPVPDWVRDWLSRRRGGTAAVSATGTDTAPNASIQAATGLAPEAAPDPKTELRAAALRERNRLEREASILAVLDDLDVWLSDQMERGLAGFAAQSGKSCRLIAQRLVDAKAPGLATRLDALPTRLFTLPEAIRPAAAVQELGLEHLLAEAYRRQDALPTMLKADVRQAIGWAVTREMLFSDESVLRVRGAWRVVAALSEVQPDRLRRLETWLYLEAESRFAVLVDFVPISTGAATGGYSVGDHLEAELVFYPSAVRLRAQIAESIGGAAACDAPLEIPVQRLGEAFALYEQAMSAQPWLGAFPLSFHSARVRRHESLLFLCDGADGASTIALPLQPSQSTLAAPLLGLPKIDGIGLWDGYFFTLCWAQTELGRWVHA